MSVWPAYHLLFVENAKHHASGTAGRSTSLPNCHGSPSSLHLGQRHYHGLKRKRGRRMTPQREDVSMTSGPVVFNAKIRNRILVRILAAASLVLVAMGLVLYLLTRQLLHAEVTAKSEAMVTLVAASMERWLVEKSAALAVLADVEAQYTAPHPA